MSTSPLASPQGPPAQAPPVARPATLEERIRRLEDVIATLQDTRQLEERIAEKVSTRMQPSTSRDVPESTGILVKAGRKLLPAALSVVRSNADGEQGTPSPGGEKESRVSGEPASSRPWVLFDLYAELRTMFRMYVDRRYRLSWMARVVPLAALAVFLFSWFIFPRAGSMLGLGTLLDKLIDLVLACLVYKVLAREAHRYRQTIP